MNQEILHETITRAFDALARNYPGWAVSLNEANADATPGQEPWRKLWAHHLKDFGQKDVLEAVLDFTGEEDQIYPGQSPLANIKRRAAAIQRKRLTKEAVLKSRTQHQLEDKTAEENHRVRLMFAFAKLRGGGANAEDCFEASIKSLQRVFPELAERIIDMRERWLQAAWEKENGGGE